MSLRILSLSLIASSAIVWVLWMNRVYPFSELFFTYDGYGIHFIGGIGYTAFQVFAFRLRDDTKPFTKQQAKLHGLVAVVALSAWELLQYFDPTRKVQVGDIIAQTLGVGISLLIIVLCNRTMLARKP